jgi:hypothetical protein
MILCKVLTCAHGLTDEVFRLSDKVSAYLNFFKELPISKLRDDWTIHVYKSDTEVISRYYLVLT